MTYGAHDPGCCSLGMQASTLLMLGYPDQVHEASLEALSLGRNVNFQTGIAHTSRYRACLFIMLNEPGLAAESFSKASRSARGSTWGRTCSRSHCHEAIYRSLFIQTRGVLKRN